MRFDPASRPSLGARGVAVFFTAALALSAGALQACGGDDKNGSVFQTTGAGGDDDSGASTTSGGVGGQGVGGATASATTGTASTTTGTASTTTGTASTTTGTASTTTSTGGADCDGQGLCGNSMVGCISCTSVTVCSAENDACNSDPDCADYVACIATCSDMACSQACKASHPTGSTLNNALVQCAICACPIDCDGPGSANCP